MRIRLLRLATCLAAVTLLHALALPARATTIDPLIWEQLVLDSAFVGVVECETAGGIVAGYRVVESWKGAPAGTRFTIRMAVNFWGPQFPITLVGQRYLVTAYKSDAPTRIMSTTFGSPVPLWWRDIPADYSLPLWQGRVRLPLAQGERPLAELGSEHAGLAAFKSAVEELLALGPEAREVRLLQALTRKYLSPRQGDDPSAVADLSAAERAAMKRAGAAAGKIQGYSSAREIARELLGLVRDSPAESGFRYTAATILSQGGGAVTLEFLQGGGLKGTHWKEDEYREVVEEIRRRMGAPAAGGTAAENAQPQTPPTARQLAEARAALARGQEDKNFGQAFELLTRHDPAPVVAYLKSWRNPAADWRDTDAGYVLGSYFAHLCGKDREGSLLALLGAEDPFIRVAAAVYLTFENPALGASKLEELTKLPGNPGAWAALNLARRGHKSAVPRALELFAAAGPRGHMSGVPHENLQLRLLVLLSNSAAASGLPQPAPPDQPDYDAGQDAFNKYQESLYRYFVEWWRANSEKVELRDPWLKTLERRKVD